MPRSAGELPESTLRLLLAGGVGPATLRRLRERFGSDDLIVSAAEAQLADVPGIGRGGAARLRRELDQADVEGERRSLQADEVNLLLAEDPDYPPLLRLVDDPPPALWIRGELRIEDQVAIALVGSRKCTAYGRDQAGRFASLLAQAGLTIVSGGALGVDGEAHRAALRVGGRTIVVAGCGLATAYPPDHAALFDRIVRERCGAVISEFPMATPPAAGNFPRRNRVISGMSLGVLVIEAAMRSGALITARLAAEEHHREVMALPGRVDSPASAGCHKAIREGWAALVTSHADVMAQLDASGQLVRGALEASGLAKPSGATLFQEHVTEAQQAIIGALTSEQAPELSAEQIAALTELPLSQVMADITLLEIRGRLRRQWGGGIRLRSSTPA